MPTRDAYHHIVRTALEKESWQITHDPLRLVLGRRKGYVDLAAEKLLAAQRGTRKIAVEPGRRSDKEFSGGVNPR